MKVLAIRDTCEGAPKEVVEQGYSETNKGVFRFITRGKEYEVHAIVVWTSGIIRFCIISDPFPDRILGERVTIKWLPVWFFSIVDPSMPDDWECHLFEHPPIIIGPAFISESPDAYRRMAELDRRQTNRFWERIKRLDELNS